MKNNRNSISIQFWFFSFIEKRTLATRNICTTCVYAGYIYIDYIKVYVCVCVHNEHALLYKSLGYHLDVSNYKTEWERFGVIKLFYKRYEPRQAAVGCSYRQKQQAADVAAVEPWEWENIKIRSTCQESKRKKSLCSM